MKNFLFLLLLAAPVRADITQTLQSVVSVKVDAASSAADRVATALTISGTNVTPTSGGTAGAIGTLNLGSVTSGVPSVEADTTFVVTNAGDNFSVTENLIVGDTIPSLLSATVTSGVIPSLPVFGSTTSTAGGVAGSLAATLDSGHTMTVTSGGAGTTGTAQATITIEVD
tara:strand:+ start:4747 stop:5256 length:510 start_codon:yes stop_codon:yes gene_type:complete